MKADTVDLAAIFGKQVRYLVPLFQRPYVWNEEDQWEPLWQDVRAVADRQLDDTPLNDAIPHFLGAVVLEQALVQSGMIESRFVIDGQQRLTTLQLLLAAARSVAAEHQLDDSRQMFETLLFNQAFLLRKEGDEFKVVPTKGDRAAFGESVRDGAAAAKGDHRIHKAFRFFHTAIVDWLNEEEDPSTLGLRMEALSTSLWKRVVVVTIDLDPGDNAQIIFETLNARGTPLLAADLIKNHLFQMATIQGAAIDSLYEKHWQALDSDWWREDVQQGRLRRPRLDIFLNHWLAMRTGTEVVSHQLFPEFKRYLADGQRRAEDVLVDLEHYARVFESWEKESPQTYLGQFLYRLGVMEVTTAYPALLWLLGPEGIGDAAEQEIALAAIESWLVRRMLIRATTKNYNVVFLALLNAVRPSGEGVRPDGEEVARYLAGLAGDSQNWPSAGDVLASLRGLPIYTSITRSRLRMVLEALEWMSHTGFTEQVILPHDLTVEHVLPQEWMPHWPLADTDDPMLARSQRDAAKHTLGNLTLVTNRLNPKLSNDPWPQKRDALRKHSVMRISADVRDAETWDEAAIAERGDRLARLAVSIWSRPEDVFEAAGGSANAPSIRVQDPDPVHVSRGERRDSEPRRPVLEEDLDLPSWVIELADGTTSALTRPLLVEFVHSVLSDGDVELRRPKSETPYYLQIRSPKIKQVIAYVAPSRTHLRIEFRLPAEHNTYGRAEALHGGYGIRLLVRERSDIALALQLTKDAAAGPVSQRNEWAKATEAPAGVAPTELGLRYQSFFSEILRRFEVLRPHLTSGKRVGTGNWYQFSAGRSGFAFVWSLAGKARFRVELYIDAGDADQNRAYLDELRVHAAELDASMGASIVWEPLDGKRACRMAVYRAADRDNFENDGELMDWAAHTMVRFTDAMKPLIQSLKAVPSSA